MPEFHGNKIGPDKNRRTPWRACVLCILAVLMAGGCRDDTDKSTMPGEVPGRDGIPSAVIVTNIDTIKDGVVIEKNVPVPMRDGVRLSARIFRPGKQGTFPVVMCFTAYGKDRGPAYYPPILDFSDKPEFDLGPFKVSPWTTWEGPDPAFWVPHGYAVVYVDTRGYFQSEGNAEVLSEKNAQDFHDAIEWAGTREWGNGNVGLNGVSYLAITQWLAASANPPHLKAIIPWEGSSDSYREVLYHGGIPETEFTKFWFSKLKDGAKNNPAPPLPVFRFLHKRPVLLRFFQDPPDFQLERIRVPALVCASWSDHGLHTRGSFEGYKQISSENKWLFTHGRPKWSTYYSDEALQFQKDFFDHYLKGIENGFDNTKPVRLEIRESLKRSTVRYEDSWPIKRTDYRKLYLDGLTGSLRDTLPVEPSSTQYNPESERALYTIRFEQDTELSGYMKLKLWVSTTGGSDMDLFVGVKKLNAGGKEVHFYAKTGYNKGPAALGWLRVSDRELDTEKSTPWQPYLKHERSMKISKNEIVPVEIEILPSSTLFRKGESLQLVVQGRDLFEHPTLGHGWSVNRGTHTIHSGGRYDSHLLVPVIP